MPDDAEVLTPEDFGVALGAMTRRRPARNGAGRIIAVDGWSGSGKTSLADRLAPTLGAPCVHLDDWVPGWSGLAASVDLLVKWVLVPLAEGRPAGWRRWDWVADRFGEMEVLAPAELVVIEGCGAGSALARPWLSTLIWLDVDGAERERRLRSRPDWPAYAPWAAMWAEQERRLRAGDDPAAGADAVVETGPEPASLLRVTWSRGSRSH